MERTEAREIDASQIGAGEIDAQRIDAHCHFWRLDRGDYGWLEGAGGPLDPIRRDFSPDDHPENIARIAVQAAPSAAETDYLLALARQDRRIRGVVGWVDFADPASDIRIDAMAADGRIVGVRPMLQDIEATDWLAEVACPRLLDRLGEHGLAFDALVTERHLPMLARVVERHEGLTVVIDHAAKPQPGRGDGWAEGMKALAGRPNVFCKLSGLLTELCPDERADPLPALRRIVEPLFDWFGPERLLWGSDWPVVTLAASYDRWKALTGRLLADLSKGEREAILGGNARRVYRLADEARRTLQTPPSFSSRRASRSDNG